MTRVALVGLGNMGGRMGRRLVDAGHEVHGYDVRGERAAELGFTPAASPAAAVRTADVVLLSLPSDAAIVEAMTGVDGVLDALTAGQIAVDLSTASPALARRWAPACAQRGAAFVDCGISGGPGGAEAGTLTLMVGGDAAVIDRLSDVFEVIGGAVFRCGGTGAGHTAKIVNNFLNGVNLAASAEAMVVGVKGGMDPRLLVDVIRASTGTNWVMENRMPRIVEGDYVPGGLTSALMAKDLDLYLGLASGADATTLMGSACRGAFAVAMATGYRDQTSTHIVDALGDLAGGVRVQADDAGAQG
jgi:3-hydroxyisobutyrate dehydrogenase-like beta-hydroxyacid dehydrogenase